MCDNHNEESRQIRDSPPNLKVTHCEVEVVELIDVSEIHLLPPLFGFAGRPVEVQQVDGARHSLVQTAWRLSIALTPCQLALKQDRGYHAGSSK